MSVVKDILGDIGYAIINMINYTNLHGFYMKIFKIICTKALLYYYNPLCRICVNSCFIWLLYVRYLFINTHS